VKWLLVASTLVVVGCRPSGTDSTNAPELFATYCTNCHGPDGKPPAAMVARYNVRDLTALEFRKTLTAERVDGQIRTGSQNGLMPSFAQLLTDKQIKALSEWVADPTFVAPR
jgi:mono/diheme cytochrome c family protein